MNDKLRSAFLEELAVARRTEQANDLARAWRHLERAHVLSQAHAWPHVRVHECPASQDEQRPMIHRGVA